MRMRWVVVMCAAIGCRSLGPGETRCTSTPVFGTVVTNCKTGAPAQVPAPAPGPEPRAPRWWCSAASARRLGACYRAREGCLVYRDGMMRDGVAMTACDTQTYADCFEALTTSGRVTSVCNPSLALCVDQREFVARNEPDGMRAIGECRTVE